jgi:hypothetical protein
MTREALRAGYEEFVTDVLDIAYQEFDVVGALRQGATGSGSRAVSKLVKRSDLLDRAVVKPELNGYRNMLFDQFEYLLEYAATDESFETFADDIIASDVYYDSLRADLPRSRREEIRAALLDYHQQLGDRMQPLVDSEATAFWAAVRDVFDVTEARAFMNEEFSFTDPIVEYRDAFRFHTQIDPGELLSSPLASALPTVDVEYTEETVRTLCSAERRVIEDVHEEIDDHYDIDR